MKNKSKNVKLWLIFLACAVVVLPALGVLIVRIENEAPQVELDLASPDIGASKDLSISISDEKSGIKKIWIGILKDGRETILIEKDFPASGLLNKGLVTRESVTFSLKPNVLGLTDGSGILRLVVTDYSWRGWGKGNRTYIEKEISIDTKAPGIEVLTDAHNISPGGVALVLYKISEPCERSGVASGEIFYPGYPAGMADEAIHIALFALAHDQGKDTNIHLEAVDRAGNKTTTGFYHYIKKKTFRKDTLRISDGFLTSKIPEFEALLVGQSQKSLVDQFLYINRDVRQQNKQSIDSVTARSEPQFYWNGTFKRLPGSATRSKFADRRTYTYKGATIDHQVHMGVDLASNAHSLIPAANRGRVVFADYLGIYGNAIIIDHGFGLFSMYAHLSSLNVEVGQLVSKGDDIGRTGKTGLAGGDHLHFSMLVHHTFVTPLEWWDATWIKNNITGKLSQFSVK